MNEKIEQLKINTIEKNDKRKSCAFTGHRTLKEDFLEKKLKKEIVNLIKEGVEVFYNGMAIGFDLRAAQILVDLKKKYTHIKWIACIPFYGQECKYSLSDKKLYLEIVKKADEQVIICEHYFKGCMQIRNEYMADRADVLIAYCNKEKGGTVNTIKYFQKKYPEKEIIFL